VQRGRAARVGRAARARRAGLREGPLGFAQHRFGLYRAVEAPEEVAGSEEGQRDGGAAVRRRQCREEMLGLVGAGCGRQRAGLGEAGREMATGLQRGPGEAFLGEL
jgi:hypothetical protein